MTAAAPARDVVAVRDPARDPAARPPGMVGVIAQDTARFSMFAASLTGLDVPPRTQIKWQIGHSIASGTNELVRAMLADPAAEWLWIMGDDHTFAPTILTRLLDRDVDVVCPLVLTRNAPYKPVMISGWHDELIAERGGLWRRYLDLDEYPDGGLVPIHSSGSAGMLVRRHVFEAMTDPWFEAGQVSSVEVGEDYYFCDKARDAGFEIHGDLDVPLGHVTTAVVWPTHDADGGWSVGFRMMGGLSLQTRPPEWDA